MDNINSIVKEKLEEFGLIPYERLDEKARRRLVEVEMFIQTNTNKMLQLKEEMKKLKLNKSFLINSKSISFSRKTLYNDSTINTYVEKSIENENDFFHEKKILKMAKTYQELKEHYDNVISHIIDTQILKLQVEEYKKDIHDLLQEKIKLHDVIADQQKIINNLQMAVKQDNLLYIDK
ncbi:TPA: hypothetical protein ACGXK0_006204 [Bacillus cereus]|uniref:hypothetical protein n=1 Tax=Bacillus cereus group TaxID=86661 RepID=UPI000BEC9FBB|nr:MULTISPECIES: hypothetical protein [Bacillus cereus group]PEF39527.1 hypothetical protein CON72_10715 [Bacillus wiedmannii]PFS49685.1 hypothetical protein COK44_07545 [Bacillus cereus]